MMHRTLVTMTAAAALAAVLTMPAGKAAALPSFARQTGKSCSACHTVFPELTAYGRNFKLEGYVSTGVDELLDASTSSTRLEIGTVPPLAAMVQASHDTKAGETKFPREFSVFYAGRIAPLMGAFTQLTYESETAVVAFDNCDFRVAKRFQVGGTDLILGGSANNNPTVQDVYNSTPAWGFPFAAGNEGPQTLIEQGGGLGLAGAGVYAFWNNLVYAEASGYRNAPQGAKAPGTADVTTAAPYGRLTLQKEMGKHSFEIGSFGLQLLSNPDGSDPAAAPHDLVTDFGQDVQYQFVGDKHIVTVKGTRIGEIQRWRHGSVAGTAANEKDVLKSGKANASYYYDRWIGVTAGYFQTRGTEDALLGALAKSTDNSPDSLGWIWELNYVPWYNAKFTAQYTRYSSRSKNGTPDESTTMLMAWLMF